MNRLVGIVAAVLWLIAMTALVQRDIVPFWTAQEPPPLTLPNDTFQVAIHNSTGTRLGTTWVRMVPTQNLTTVRSTTLLNLSSLASLLPASGPLLLDTCLTYQAGGVLDQFRCRIKGAPWPILVQGERCGRDFACATTIGTTKKMIPLDGRLSECLAENLRPFTHLKDLRVGQNWRIRLLDPFALLQGRSPDPKMQLVSVTGREPITHRASQVNCFRIETEGSVAWADATGRVLRQEVQIPLLGKWVLTDEPFDQAARHAAIEILRGETDAKPTKAQEAIGDSEPNE